MRISAAPLNRLFFYSGSDEEEHWSIEFQDSDGNVALIMCVLDHNQLSVSFLSQHRQ